MLSSLFEGLIFYLLFYVILSLSFWKWFDMYCAVAQNSVEIENIKVQLHACGRFVTVSRATLFEILTNL